MKNANDPIVDYASITINDRNPVKRRLQNTRLDHGIRFIEKNESASFNGKILDFGAGNGELTKRLASLFPESEVVCYEPVEGFREQAGTNLEKIKNARIIGNLSEEKDKRFNYILCLEVFEHLPAKETEETLEIFFNLLDRTGSLIIGVPVEIYFPALIKGLFRMTRRYGDFDAVFKNVLLATVGRPPIQRPVKEIAEGIPYIFRHMGFDYRQFKELIQKKFKIVDNYGSPVRQIPVWLNFENYFVCQLK